MSDTTEKKSYSDTVHLPRTEFPMRGELPKREPALLEFWESREIHRKLQDPSRAAGGFTLHDGPPYANGHIHIGHALNKVLKDIVVKSRALMGARAPYVPGWDCHGLPIEHALLKEKKMSKRSVRDVAAFRREAVAFAERFIGIQRDEFRRLGVLGDWDRPYTTMSRGYESAILRAFRRLYAKGYIYRGKKTVSWCVTCETALAEAEVEYKPKTSPSVYVALPVRDSRRVLGEEGVSVLVWTTTPWTLPANQAVAFHPELRYRLFRAGGRTLLLAEPRAADALKALGAEGAALEGAWTGRELVGAGLVCETPFAYLPGFAHKDSRGVLADTVSADEGTGIVHTAPGHGADDYNTGVREGLAILCPVDGGGRFTEEAGPLAGKRLFDEANEAVIAELSAAGRLLARASLSHNYQHCWRCKNPIAFRATEQWFLSVTHDGLREKLLAAIGSVDWIPAAGRERIAAMVSSRPDWCLSRQRLWGTPIPIFSCAGCRRLSADDDALAAVERRVAEQGSDFWFESPGAPVAFAERAPAGAPRGPDLTPRGDASGERPRDALAWPFMPPKACPGCAGTLFVRETDILDVWVDSGASWLAVLGEEAAPCDLYLEGSDQHRGWFQSSLVLAVALTGRAPYKAVLTHGFVLDDQGRAMHKSLGNVVSPQEVISKLGADVLRLWVALADYSDDVRLSEKLLAGPTESYRKFRNTLRYLLGNICDFDPARDRVEHAAMPELERVILAQLWDCEAAILRAYESYAFRKAATRIDEFCNLTLSSFYLDVRKDALYTLRQGDPARRAAQTVMWECLVRLLQLAAPILSFTCEEAWAELRKTFGAARESVFLQEHRRAPEAWRDGELLARWEHRLHARSAVLKALEEARAARLIGKSLEAKVRYGPADEAERAALACYGAEALAELCIISEFELVSEPGARVERAGGGKCPRCWRFRTDRGVSAADPELCARCVRQLA